MSSPEPTISVRPCTRPEELLGAASPIAHYFGSEVDRVWLDRWLTFFQLERMHAAFEGATIVGGAGAFGLDLTVPGGSVPAAAVSVVGVLPTHRRRGVLTALMREQLGDVRRRGEPIACLWASETTIYGRFGYGLAAMAYEVAIPKAYAATRSAPPVVGRPRLVSEDEALDLFPPIYDRVRARTPGMLTRSRAWWKGRRMLDLPERRGGGGVLQRVVLEVDGRPEAYGLYRMHFRLEHGAGAGMVDVLEAVGATPEATRSIWSFLLEIDWTATVRATVVPVDTPLRLLLADPRHAELRLYDTLWVRLVDVGAALSARSLATDARVVIEVRDAFCPWNEGRWSVGRGGARRTDEPADLALDVADLGSLYLGAFGVRELVEAGRVDALRDGAVERADALFQTERPPYAPEMF